MAVYHFTLHAYRSWSPANPRGYVRRDEGILDPDPEMARKYDERAKFPKALFDSRDIQEILVLGCIDICRRREWRLHAAGTDPSHLHFVLSWHGYVPWSQVMRTIKNLLGLFLNRATGQPGRRWFVRDGSRKRVKQLSHFRHLVTTYLPGHPGIFWREGMPIPEDRFGILEPRSCDGSLEEAEGD